MKVSKNCDVGLNRMRRVDGRGRYLVVLLKISGVSG